MIQLIIKRLIKVTNDILFSFCEQINLLSNSLNAHFNDYVFIYTDALDRGGGRAAGR